MKTIVIGNSDEDADWLKTIKNGKFQKQDLQASEDAAKLHKQPKLHNLMKKLRNRKVDNNG